MSRDQQQVKTEASQAGPLSHLADALADALESQEWDGRATTISGVVSFRGHVLGHVEIRVLPLDHVVQQNGDLSTVTATAFLRGLRNSWRRPLRTTVKTEWEQAQQQQAGFTWGNLLARFLGR